MNEDQQVAGSPPLNAATVDEISHRIKEHLEAGFKADKKPLWTNGKALS
jgi:hypothetical protein